MGARILLIDHADFIGGAEQSALQLLTSLDPNKYCATLACPPGALMDAARARQVRVATLRLPQVRGRKNVLGAPLKLAAGVRDVMRLIRRERAGIVHANTMRATVYAAPAARLAGRPFVWHVRDLHREHVYLAIVSRMARAIIANSHAVARAIPSFAQGKTTVVYNGVNLHDFDPAPWDGAALRNELALPANAYLVGNIGWIAPWKRQDEFIESAAHIAAGCPQARFVIAGDASDPRYASYARELRERGTQLLGDRLSWLGARQPIQPVLAALDVVLHCAEQEPFGRVLIEAMAMRVPVVAFAGGGPAEIIAHPETGLLVAPHDVTLMAEQASALLADPDRRRAMGECARSRVQSLFDSEVNAQQVERIYESLAGR